jgi:hypothetical protein
MKPNTTTTTESLGIIETIHATTKQQQQDIQTKLSSRTETPESPRFYQRNRGLVCRSPSAKRTSLGSGDKSPTARSSSSAARTAARSASLGKRPEANSNKKADRSGSRERRAARSSSLGERPDANNNQDAERRERRAPRSSSVARRPEANNTKKAMAMKEAERFAMTAKQNGEENLSEVKNGKPKKK